MNNHPMCSSQDETKTKNHIRIMIIPFVHVIFQIDIEPIRKKKQKQSINEAINQ
jgi:hypothetical protein